MCILFNKYSTYWLIDDLFNFSKIGRRSVSLSGQNICKIFSFQTPHLLFQYTLLWFEFVTFLNLTLNVDHVSAFSPSERKSIIGL